MENKIIEKKKIPGLAYAFTDNGIELPVLDITHPLFISSINRDKLFRMLKEIEKKGKKRAENFRKIPVFIKNFLIRRSYIMAGLLLRESDDTYLSGMSTLLMKLGPGLIGRGINKFFDRLASKSFGAIVLRMRVRDISKLQAEMLGPRLVKNPGKDLCLINIAGGTAGDSINSLIILQKKDPMLLKGRNIEINVLDVDAFGPGFAGRCVESLKNEGYYFHGLNISFRHIRYDWKETGKLRELLTERNDWLKICSSEGGLFEYAEDDVMIRNLDLLYTHTPDDFKIVGSILRDKDKVDPAIIAAMNITGIKARLLGVNGLKYCLSKSNWMFDDILQDNPRYIVFSLKKRIP